MKSIAGTLAAPFPYFGGKSNAAETVWSAFGDVDNYVEAFSGSAAMLLSAPNGKRIETINDFDGFVANFWRAISHERLIVSALEQHGPGDHILSRNNGGSHHPDNLQCLCQSCNSRKATLEDKKHG